MSLRLKRLKADYDRFCTLFTQKSRIRIKKIVGDPPERYQLEYLVSGLEKSLTSGMICSRNSFIVEITLTAAYPRMAPQCRMLTPVFHPNIAPHAICIGDHWAAGESLANLVVRIAEMLAYQSYNVKSPLNGEAAQWAELNQDQLPLDSFDFSSLLSIGHAVGRGSDGRLTAGAICANCGKQDQTGEMKVCLNQHVTCDDCVMECAVCNKTLCLKCSLAACTLCKKVVCPSCAYKCGSCGGIVCPEHRASCSHCSSELCHSCLLQCSSCRQLVCTNHAQIYTRPEGDTRYRCNACSAREGQPPLG